MNKPFITVPHFHILMEYLLFKSQPSNIKGVKQLATNICGYCRTYFKKPLPLHINLMILIVNEIKDGAKYAKILYSGGIIGSIVL